ncbi:MAG TPA: single-stranded-DNA-specific exonuclease RecJ [Nevskiaceae bacterium]|nr:single-stranded-DNA-specific exonuclease RecJ [Nevskiaceae bacterium]
MSEAATAPFARRRPAGQPELLPATLNPVVRRVYAQRGIASTQALETGLDQLLPPCFLNIERAAGLLADALAADKHIVIAGDYDTDGATGATLGVLGLRALGAAHVDFVVPNRFTMGYGLSPALVEQVQARGGELIVTVDNGIASLAGVAAARAAGISVVVTDHHLAPAVLPDADVIIDPNQPGCPFPSKCVAGVGVMFYLLLASRAELRRRGVFGTDSQPRLADFLDLVALGTVADVVPLDHNNRVLVARGLARMRAGRCRPGILALLAAARRDARYASAADLGFAVGPRLNAAGRLDDMTVGIRCLLAPDATAAKPLAGQLDALNRDRRVIEGQMRDEALAAIDAQPASGVVVYNAGWHEGVVGLVAARVRERTHRPTVAFAPSAVEGELKGSGRSIRGVHLRDVLARVDASNPGVILRFGGHAMAAGLTLKTAYLEHFRQAFVSACEAALVGVDLDESLETDGALSETELALPTAQALEAAGPFGQGFAPPLFDGRFEVVDVRPVGADGRHVRYRLRSGSTEVTAVHFDGAETAVPSGVVEIVYELLVNRFHDAENAELRIHDLRPVVVGVDVTA